MKNAMLIAPTFYEYYKDIIKSLEKLGFKTTYYSDAIVQNNYSKILNRIHKGYKRRRIDLYIDKICKRQKNNFDVVIIILAYDFSVENIVQLRKRFSNAKFIYYAWDSVATFPIIRKIAELCDYKYSFDPQDCSSYGYDFLPLFYSKRYSDMNCEKKYLCCSIMNFYASKVKGFEKIRSLIGERDNCMFYLRINSFVFYLYSKIKYKKIYKNYKFRDLKTKSLKRDEAYNYYASSKIIIDTPLATQVGLTMRTFEALAFRCKLITTNKNITNYQFYSESNIFIVDDNTKEIPESFFLTDFNDNECPIEDYSVDCFTKKLIGKLS